MYDMTMRCDAMRCDAMRCDAMRCDAMRCDAMRCDAMRCDAMRCDAMRCDAMRYDTIVNHSIHCLWQGCDGDMVSLIEETEDKVELSLSILVKQVAKLAVASTVDLTEEVLADELEVRTQMSECCIIVDIYGLCITVCWPGFRYKVLVQQRLSKVKILFFETQFKSAIK